MTENTSSVTIIREIPKAIITNFYTATLENQIFVGLLHFTYAK